MRDLQQNLSKVLRKATSTTTVVTYDEDLDRYFKVEFLEVPDVFIPNIINSHLLRLIAIDNRKKQYSFIVFKDDAKTIVDSNKSILAS